LATLFVCSMSAPASAQAPPPPPTDPPAEAAPAGSGGTVDMRGAMKRYDFDQGNQYLWGAVGGTVGSLALGAAAFGVGGALCQQGPRDCRVSQTLLGLMGWSTGLIAGSMVAVNLTGGERAELTTQLASFGGVFLGVLAAGTVIGLLPNDVLGEGGSAQFFAVSAGVGVAIGSLAGLGAAFGYQAAYPEPKPWQVGLTPMLLPDGGGLVLGGRF
jgi:hypothetical protein